jgi:hypothetical protein
MVVFSHINGSIENLSGLMFSKHIPEIVKIIRSRPKDRIRHPYTSRKELAQLFNIAFNSTYIRLGFLCKYNSIPYTMKGVWYIEKRILFSFLVYQGKNEEDLTRNISANGVELGEFCKCAIPPTRYDILLEVR